MSVLQRTHGLFGNRVDSFSTEPTNADAAQMTSQRPLQFSDSQPESPPNSSALVPTTEFFPTNTNNNAFAEWVAKSLLYDMMTHIQGEYLWCRQSVLSFRFSFEREGSPEEFYNPSEDAEPGTDLKTVELKSVHVLK